MSLIQVTLLVIIIILLILNASYTVHEAESQRIKGSKIFEAAYLQGVTIAAAEYASLMVKFTSGVCFNLLSVTYRNNTGNATLFELWMFSLEQYLAVKSVLVAEVTETSLLAAGARMIAMTQIAQADSVYLDLSAIKAEVLSPCFALTYSNGSSAQDRYARMAICAVRSTSLSDKIKKVF